jgi:hypothetical protein
MSLMYQNKQFGCHKEVSSLVYDSMLGSPIAWDNMPNTNQGASEVCSATVSQAIKGRVSGPQGFFCYFGFP